VVGSEVKITIALEGDVAKTDAPKTTP
jgi:hypothetical protein